MLIFKCDFVETLFEFAECMFGFVVGNFNSLKKL